MILVIDFNSDFSAQNPLNLRLDEGRELAIEGTMTVVVLQDGKPVEIPLDLRVALSGESN